MVLWPKKTLTYNVTLEYSLVETGKCVHMLTICKRKSRAVSSSEGSREGK